MVQCFSGIYELGESQKGCLHVHGGKTILKDQRTFRLVTRTHFCEISQLALINE